MNPFISEVIQTVQHVYGSDISHFDEAFIQRSLEGRYLDLDMNILSSYLLFLSENSEEYEMFMKQLNVTYSEFFRNPLSFACLEQLILPRLLEEKANSEIRVWCAGCAAGQEAYSIAMLLDKLIYLRGNTARFRVVASDISELSLTKARVGCYDSKELQNVSLGKINKYFKKKEDQYTISSQIKEHVYFSTYDLLDKHSDNPAEGIYGNFDIVFCSNLLFYYRKDIQKFIVKKILRSLFETGWLVTGEAETFAVAKVDGLHIALPYSSIFQKKKSRG